MLRRIKTTTRNVLMRCIILASVYFFSCIISKVAFSRILKIDTYQLDVSCQNNSNSSLGSSVAHFGSCRINFSWSRSTWSIQALKTVHYKRNVFPSTTGQVEMVELLWLLQVGLKAPRYGPLDIMGVVMC